MIDSALLELAGSQHGVLARSQLRTTIGMSDSTIKRHVRDGAFLSVAFGVVRLASAPDSFAARCMAATLYGGDVGFVTGFSAARHFDLRKMPDRPIHFAVPRGFRRQAPSWLKLRYTEWYDRDRDRVDDQGIAVAEPHRMLFAVAADANQFRLDRAADDAWHHGLIDPVSVAAYLESHRCRGKNGVLRLERWLERAAEQTAPSHSDLERKIIEAVERIGLPAPVRQHRLRLRTGETVRLDAAWPGIRFAIEPGHSWFHPQAKDNERDLGCSEVGWQILRLNERMLAAPHAAARQVAVAYRARRQLLDPLFADDSGQT